MGNGGDYPLKEGGGEKRSKEKEKMENSIKTLFTLQKETIRVGGG